jgi:hypothetical protein
MQREPLSSNNARVQSVLSVWAAGEIWEAGVACRRVQLPADANGAQKDAVAFARA